MAGRLPSPAPTTLIATTTTCQCHGGHRSRLAMETRRGDPEAQGGTAPRRGLHALRLSCPAYRERRGPGTSRPKGKGPLPAPRSWFLPGSELREAAMSPSLRRQRSRHSHEAQATGAVNRLSAPPPPIQGWEPQSPQAASGLQKHRPSLPTLPPPIPTPQRQFSSQPFLRKVKERAGSLAGWPVSASVASLQPGRGRVLVAKETLT